MGVDDVYVDAVYANTLLLLTTVTTTADVLDVWVWARSAGSCTVQFGSRFSIRVRWSST